MKFEPGDYDYSVFIEFAPYSQWAGEDGEPSRFFHDRCGRIAIEHPEHGRRRAGGSFRCQFLDLESALNERVAFSDVFDTTASAFEIYETLYDFESGELRDEVKALLYGPYDHQPKLGVLILDRLQVLPTHRGNRVGLRVMKCLIEHFRAGTGLVVLKAFPLQFEGDGPPSREESERGMTRQRLLLDNFTRSHRVARAKLKRYYGLLGFVPVPKTEFMVLDTDKQLPAISELDELAIPPAPKRSRAPRRVRRPQLRRMT